MVKLLPLEHKDWIWDPKHLRERRCMPVTPALGSWKEDGSQSQPGSSSIGELRVGERTCLKKKKKKVDVLCGLENDLG